MKLTRKYLRKIIQESIVQQNNSNITSLNEDLYASGEEEEKAIKDMMNLYSISYEEAAKIIKLAGDEMDDQPGWQESISLEKEQINNLNDFLEQSQRGKQLVSTTYFMMLFLITKQQYQTLRVITQNMLKALKDLKVYL